MTVYVAYAPADRGAAEALEKAIERRGHFVELDDGQTALPPVEAKDVLVLLISRALTLATTRLRLEQRALDAWAERRLVLVRLDETPAPVGLRDLPAIDAREEADRESAWQEAADAVRGKLTQRGVETRAAGGVRFGLTRALIMAALMLPGLVALAATASIWLVNRIGPSPGGWAELRAGVDQFGIRYGAPSGVTEWLFIAAIALAAVVAGSGAGRLLLRARAAAAHATFVSFDPVNAPVVLPMLEAARRAGRRLCARERDAGDLMEAIGEAEGVVVMCSKAAFESDQVKREVFLADRFRKRLASVFIEKAEPPEDFQYFFAGSKSLDLFETPEAERPQALLRMLGAAS